MLVMLFHGIYALAVPNPNLICMAQHHLRLSRKSLHLALEFLGHPFVIGVEKGKPFTGCGSYTGIPGSTDTEVILLQICKLRIFFAYKVFCTVSGAVIHNHHRVSRKGLTEERIDTSWQEVSTVKGWDNYGDPGGTHVSAELVAEIGRKLIHSHSLLSHGISFSYSNRLISQRI